MFLAYKKGTNSKVSTILGCLKKSLTIILLLLATIVSAQEICNNGIDDDNDGDIDLNDIDCECEGFGSSQNLSSLIPNSSFEDRSCCPNSFSELGCADTWIQASNPTSDYWHNCGQAGNSAFGLAPQPIPDGDGFVGFYNNDGWQEYVGACLSAPMEVGTNYELSFYIAPSTISPAFNLTFYGSPNCNDLPFNSDGCPVGIGGWTQIGQIAIPALNGWTQYTVTFTPSQTINAIVMGGGCGEGTSSYSYYYMDGLSLNATDLFSVLHLDRTGRWCDDNIVLTASKDTTLGTYQWYRDGVAIVGETNDNLNVSASNYGAGEYTVVLTINGQCESLSTEVIEAPDPVALGDVHDDCETEVFSFTDQSNVSSGAIVNWLWEFGDSDISTQQNATHEYGQDGFYNVSLTVETDSGCTDTYLTTVTAYPKPEADFMADDGCLYNAVNFTDLSIVDAPDNIAVWNWTFEPNNTSSLSNPSYSYGLEGNYDVELIVETNNGCKDTVAQTITLNAVPVADFTFDTLCAGNQVSFADNSSISIGSISSHQWNFNPGISSIANPQHSYATGGQYSVNLLVISDQNCRDSITYTVPVHPNPVADFSFIDVCFNQVNDFQDLSTVSTGAIVAWNWDFGSNNTSNNQHSSHIFGTSGIHDVYLEVQTDMGCIDDTMQAVQVHDLPVADFSFNNECLSDAVQITESSTILSGNITSWQWDFGDQATYSGQNPPDHQYQLPDSFDITLIVQSGNACADTLVQSVEIYPEPLVDFSFHNTCLGEINYFFDVSTLGSGSVAGWNWDFGDVSNSTIQDPTHSYVQPGSYNVKLEVITDHGCENDTSHFVVVNPLPEVGFSFSNVCLNETTEFFDDSDIESGSLVRWEWDFGDNTDGLGVNTSHIYQDDGLYTVNLVVTSDSLCVDSVQNDVTVYPLPETFFISDVVEGCQPLEVNFIDQSTVSSGSIVGWLWNMGEKNVTSDAQFPNYTYTDTGTYTLSLKVVTDNGCLDSLTINDMITVYPVPYASFDASPQPTTIVYPWVEFSDASSNDVMEWDWSFGDGTFGVLQNEAHEYPDTGAYLVTLIVHNQYGCTDTTDDIILINGDFTFYIPNAFTPNNDGYNDEFFGQGIGINKYALRIYNRWGEQVFFTDDPNVKWDGTIRGGTEPVQNEVFVYRVELEDILGEIHIYNGHVTLIR